MKKLLIALLLLLLIPASAHAVTPWFVVNPSYVGGNTAFNTATDCSGVTMVNIATDLTDGDLLVANGYTIAVTENIGSASVTVTLTTEGTDYGGADGGGFTYDTNTTTGKTIYTHIVPGTTDVLTITGAGTGIVLTINGNITGGGTNVEGVYDTRTAGTVTVNGNLTGGTSLSGEGYYFGGDPDTTLVINGNCTGNVGPGLNINVGNICTVNGDAIAGTGGGSAQGVNNSFFNAGSLTITGSIVGSPATTGASGRYRWVPSDATKYIKINGGGTEIYASVPPAGSSILSTASYVDSTDGTYKAGTASAGGGRSYGF